MHRGCGGLAVLLVVAFVLLGRAGAQVAPGSPGLPEQAQLVNGVLVPVPGEIFRALDEFRDSNWNTILDPDLANLRPAGTSVQMALTLGLMLGEGFAAIAAQDAAETQRLGKAAVKLARALGVERAMVRREKSILDHVEEKDWAGVRREWSNMNADLKAAMIELKSEPLAQLVSIGGWLRGVQVLSGLVLQHYSPERARLLQQPVVLGYFSAQIGRMNEKYRSDPIVKDLEKAVGQLQPLLGNEARPAISARDLREVRNTSGKLIARICEG